MSFRAAPVTHTMSSITEDLRPLDEQAFGARVERHRRELHVHCHRLLGSFEDAEDLDQQLEPRPAAYVWHKSDDILDSLAAYCQRISDLGR
jgi:hypothetical protein